MKLWEYSNWHYEKIGVGYCNSDWVYLPEGSYPDRLTENDDFYDFDAIRECMNRCLNAYENSIAGAIGKNGDTTIGNQAFFIRSSDLHCACAQSDCPSQTSTDYISYSMSEGTLLYKLNYWLYIFYGFVIRISVKTFLGGCPL